MFRFVVGLIVAAVVDWAAAANEPTRSPGRLDDPPPHGSAAALLGT